VNPATKESSREALDVAKEFNLDLESYKTQLKSAEIMRIREQLRLL
jgi:hypothetical protein